MGSLTIMMVVQLALLFCTVQAFPRYNDPDEGDMEAFQFYDNLADELETAQNDIGVQLQDYGETEQQESEVQFVNCEKLRSTLKVCDPPKCKSRKCNIKRREIELSSHVNIANKVFSSIKSLHSFI